MANKLNVSRFEDELVREQSMPKTVSASEAKNNLGSLLKWVGKDDESVIVENRGAPAAAIISIAEYEQLQVLKEKARREEALAGLRQLRAQIQERNKDLTLEEADAIADEITRDAINSLIAKGTIWLEE
jgi:prevent-host-death family protein